MRIYIAGPYVVRDAEVHDIPRQVQKNVDNAIRVFHKLKAMGHEPFVPHLSHYLHLAGDDDYGEWWYEYDMSFLRLWAEGIIMLDGWANSKGSCMEMHEAERLGLQVFQEGVIYTEGPLHV